MPSSVRPKGSASGSRAPPVTPMSERQQMALLMQMTSSTNEVGSRSPSSTRTRERNERGWTPLHEACNHGWYEVALRLVQSGASMNAKGLGLDTPLHDAVANGHAKLARLLVEHGADVHAKNAKGKSPLDLAPAAMRSQLLNPVPESTVSSSSSNTKPRLRDEKKAVGGGGDAGKQKAAADDAMEAESSPTSADDVYEFKAVKDAADASPGQKSVSEAQDSDREAISDPLSICTAQAEESNKRSHSELTDPPEEASAGPTDEESRRKKRKDDQGKGATQKGAGQTKGNSGKQSAASQNKASALGSGKSLSDKKSPCSSPKPTVSDAEIDDGKTDLKVPPLKIVIPQTTSSEQETGTGGRNGKSGAQRSHQALPYVVASSGSSNDSNEKEPPVGAVAAESSCTAKGDEKKESLVASPPEERCGSSHQRILRSSHQRPGADRSSNNCSPQMQRSESPSPTSSPLPMPQTQADVPVSSAPPQAGAVSRVVAESQAPASSDAEPSTSASCSTASVPAPVPVDLHPRKRKMKQNKDPTPAPVEQPETPAEVQVHPHEQPITNCYQLFLNIRNQIGKRRRGLFPVQPKPPQGFKDYLMNRCTYVLAGTAPTTPNITYPQTLPPQMKDLFTDQEKERYRLRTQHVIEKEKLVLSVEQEILRVHGRAARALANQSLPFSVCTILRDEEVYNLITPEQEEKDRNARSRYNGRLFLSWLQDVDDKWEKIKEHMLLRHHNEAESMHAVQKMDWEWKMKELNLCDRKTTPKIDETHVPMVHVSDDFDLLPA